MLQAASMQHTAYHTGIAYSSLQDLYAKRLMAGDWRLPTGNFAGRFSFCHILSSVSKLQERSPAHILASLCRSRVKRLFIALHA